MIAKARQILKTDLVKVSFFSSISTLVRMLTGFVSVKVVASIIGPSGVALVGQLSNFSSIILTFATGGILNGVTKYVAEYREDTLTIKKVLQTGLLVILTMSVCCAVLMIVFAERLSISFLHSKDLKIVFIIFGFTVVLYSLNTFLIAVLNGLKEFRRYNIINISEAFIGLIFSIILAYIYGVKGALVGAVTYQSIVLFVTLILMRRSSLNVGAIFKIRMDRGTLKKYLHYSLMAIVFACVTPFAQLLVRDNIIQHISLSEAGIWEGMNRISNMYLMVITTSLSVYYLPRLSEIKDNVMLRAEIFQAYKIIMPFLLLATMSIFLCRNLIIHILFTNEFEPMQRLFLPQMIGDFFKIASWLLAFQMVAKSMTKTFIVSEILGSASFLLLSIIFVSELGLVGASWAYALNYIIYFVAMTIIFRKLLLNRHK